MDDVRPHVATEATKFVDRLRLTIRRRGLSYATEKTYVHWAIRFIRFHRMQHPEKIGAFEVEQFLGDLAERKRCAVATQRLALNALVFLYSKHLGIELGKLRFHYARRQRRMPTVFTHAEATAIIQRLSGTYRTIGALMYGSGLRVNEVLRRHHRHSSTIQRAVKDAIRTCRLRRKASCHTFRHSFATRLIETVYDIKLVQSLLGHRDIRTTEIYLHVVRNRCESIASPVDEIDMSISK